MSNYYIFDLKQYSKDEIFQKSIQIFTQNENTTIIILNNNEFVSRMNYENCLRYLHILQSDKEINDEDYSYKCILNHNKLVTVEKNMKYKKKYDYTMTKNRWETLYKGNSYLIEYLKNNLGKKIVVTGEYALDVYYYIKKYGTHINIEIVNNDEFLKIGINYNKWNVIDTNNMSIEIRKKLVGNNNYYRLSEICNLIEVEKFKKNYLNKYYGNFLFIEVPTTDKSLNLTEDEKKRIMSGRNYKSFLQDETPEIVALKKRFLEDYYNQQMINDICFPATITIVNGLLSQQSFANDNFHVINGKRMTTNCITDSIKNVNFYGNCIVFGQMVDDFNTIPSAFQRKLNDNNLKINAVNYGIKTLLDLARKNHRNRT